MPLNMEFETYSQAVDHAKSWGGWLFYRRSDGHTIWFDAAKVTVSQALAHDQNAGLLGMWPEVETYARLYES